MSIDNIINGKVTFSPVEGPSTRRVNVQDADVVFFQEGVFQGLIPILNCYLENMEVDVDTRCTILNYLKLIKKRASGKIPLKRPPWVRVSPAGRLIPHRVHPKQES